ncbi:MAG: rhodanese-like domain-containing protein [Bacteroidota bacterium]
MADLSQPEWTLRLQQDDNAFILDVRTQDEVAEGMIPNAHHIDIHKGQGFIDEIEKLDKSKSYYVYCKSGGRSAQACSIMSQMGFENTFNLEGGFSEWAGDVEMP